MRSSRPTVLMSLLVIAACGDKAPSAPTPAPSANASVVRLTVAPVDAKIAVRSTEQFTARATYADGSGADVTSRAVWASDNPDLATVDTQGQVTGVKQGTATIRASFGGVSEAATAIIEARRVTISVIARSFVCVQDCDAGIKGDGDFVYSAAVEGRGLVAGSAFHYVIAETRQYPSRDGITRLTAGQARVLNKTWTFHLSEDALHAAFSVGMSATEWDVLGPDSRLDNEYSEAVFRWSEPSGWGLAPGEHQLTLGSGTCLVRFVFELRFSYD